MSTLIRSSTRQVNQTSPVLVRRRCRTAEKAAEASVVDLVDRARGGDSAAWDMLVGRFSQMVWTVARSYRLSPADAADVSQTTWMRLVENLDRIEQPERVGAWLATTARRESLRVVRLAGRQVPSGEDMDALPDPSPARGAEFTVVTRQAGQVVADLVCQLPARSQLLLRMLNAEVPLSYKEISDALDMPIGSIGPTRARALEHLRRLALRSGMNPDDLFRA